MMAGEKVKAMKEFITVGYSYNELSETAKENVKQWYLEDEIRNEFFYEDIVYTLKESFPRSDLKVTYSLSCCQGDGLNIYGNLNLYDFIEKWNATEKEKRRIEFYLNNSSHNFTFENNHRYSYSCKFIDKKYIDDYVNDMIDDLQYNGISNINSETIKQFYIDMLDHFEKLDKQFETDGYNYLYNCDDEEVEDFCMANDYYFTEDGTLI